MFKYSVKLIKKELMDEIKDDDEPILIEVKRPFIPRFIKELNHQHNQKLKKAKGKQKALSPMSAQKLQKFEQIGVPSEHKSSKKLPQINRNGNRIIATWKNDQIQGEAQIYYHNGVTFKGVYQNGIKVKGHFKFLNGYQYIGNCLGNKFYGEGSLIFPSGKIISGEWKEYTLIGNGKIQYPKGEVYYGQVKDFKKHGKGYLFFSDGTKYVGEFNCGQISGNGTYFIDDKPVSSGQWVNGQLLKSMQLDHEDNITLQEMHSTGHKQIFVSIDPNKERKHSDSQNISKPSEGEENQTNRRKVRFA